MSGLHTSNADLRIDKEYVSPQNPIPVKMTSLSFDASNLDAFSRLRVSEPFTIFDVQHQYNTQPLLWKDIVENGGEITHLPNESSVSLTVGTLSGSKSCRQTKEYFRYQPGKSQFITMTGVLGDKKEGVAQRIGYFDDKNGMFFEQDQNDFYVVLRSNVSGNVVDVKIPKSEWNLNKLDGNSDNQTTVDTSKAQIFIIDLQWLGVGRIRYALNIGGEIIYVHQILNSNLISNVYTSTANLPLRYELFNTSATESNTNLKQICASVVSEGGYVKYGIPFTANNGSSPISISSKKPILSIKARDTFNSIENNASIIPLETGILVQSNPVFFEIVYGGTLTSANWQKVNNDHSVAEYDISATAISGGIVMSSGYLSGQRSQAQPSPSLTKGLLSKLAINKDNIYSLVCTPIGGSASCFCSIDWHEIY
jgi:hypothetical protein